MRYIKYGVLLEESQEWQRELYNFETYGKGDCVFRSALASMAYDDHNMMQRCIQLLNDRKRWPDELNHELDYKYRSQKKMTRDPFIMTICAIMQIYDFYIERFINDVKIPWYLYRPHIWAWRKYLITGKEKYKKRYEFWQLVSLRVSSNKMYALHLVAWAAYTANSDKIKSYMYNSGLIPSWNLLIKALCKVPIPNIKSYQPKIRYQWTAEEWYDGPLYDGPYKLDKDILTYILEK